MAEVAVTVTVRIEATEDGGWYVADVPDMLDNVPHDEAEHVGFPHVTPVESLAPPSVTVAVSVSC